MDSRSDMAERGANIRNNQLRHGRDRLHKVVNKQG
jgi:hypothetical protein